MGWLKDIISGPQFDSPPAHADYMVWLQNELIPAVETMMGPGHSSHLQMSSPGGEWLHVSQAGGGVCLSASYNNRGLILDLDRWLEGYCDSRGLQKKLQASGFDGPRVDVSSDQLYDRSSFFRKSFLVISPA